MSNIERALIASLLNNEQSHEVNAKHFTNTFHIKLINGYNRLKELQEPIDFELLRNKFIKANKWSIQEDNMLLDIMCNTTPFGSKEMLNRYYDVLKQDYNENSDRRYAI